MTADNDKKPKGFSGLSDLASEIGNNSDPRPPAENEEVKSPPEPEHESGSSSQPIQDPVTSCPPIQQQKTGQKEDNSRLAPLIFGALIIILALYAIASNPGNDTPTTTPRSFSQEYSSEQTNHNDAPPSLIDSEPPPAPITAQNDGLQYTKPPEGTNNVLSVPEIRWCLRESMRINAMRDVIQTNAGIDEFNRSVEDYNCRCGQYRYHQSAYFQADRDVENHRDEIITDAINDGKLLNQLRPFVPNGPLQEEQSFGDYVVRTYRIDVGEGSFEILRNRIRVHDAHGYKFQIGSIYEEDKTNSLISIGSDITGDGKPNLVVSEWTGGAHCCFLFHVFEIGDRFRYIQTINAEHSDRVDFENLDDDPALEFPMADWTFAYWRTSFAASPAPKVIFKYKGEKYEMAYDLMRKPSLPRDELVQVATDIRTSEEWREEQPPVMLWAKMLDLIYTGNMNQAWVLVELSWPDHIDGKAEFLKDFKHQLAMSPYWKDVQELNKKKT